MRTFLISAAVFLHILAVPAGANPLDGQKIDEITGAKGSLNKEENVYKVTFPRDDVKVGVDGVQMPPFMGLTSWAAFTPGMKEPAMVMGDIVLFQDEVNPAMSATLEGGLAVTAFTIGRTVKMPCGCSVGKEMGVNTWAAFYGSPEQAIVDGDFVTFDGELQTVLKTLRANNINVVAIHNHMEGESPKAIFLHYWGIGPAEKLAQGVKAALDAQAKVKQP